MSRECLACAHPDRIEIEGALLKESAEAVAARFGLSKWALNRHKRNHLVRALAAAPEVRDAIRVDQLLERIGELEAKVDHVLAQAESDGDMGLVLKAVREARENLSLSARLLGELREGLTINVAAIVGSPDFARLADKLKAALAPFPVALAAVRAALEDHR